MFHLNPKKEFKKQCLEPLFGSRFHLVGFGNALVIPCIPYHSDATTLVNAPGESGTSWETKSGRLKQLNFRIFVDAEKWKGLRRLRQQEIPFNVAKLQLNPSSHKLDSYGELNYFRYE